MKVGTVGWDRRNPMEYSKIQTLQMQSRLRWFHHPDLLLWVIPLTLPKFPQQIQSRRAVSTDLGLALAHSPVVWGFPQSILLSYVASSQPNPRFWWTEEPPVVGMFNLNNEYSIIGPRFMIRANRIESEPLIFVRHNISSNRRVSTGPTLAAKKNLHCPPMGISRFLGGANQ